MTEISFASEFSRPHVTESLAQQFLRHHEKGDWHSVASMVADDLSVVDRRQETTSPVPSAEALNSILDSFGDDGGDLLAIRVIAERGHRHALIHITLTYPPFGVHDLLLAMECSAAEQVSRLELFDGDALIDASRALARLHLESLPENLAATFAVGADLMAAIWARDLDHVDRLLADDVTHVDHRLSPALRLERAQLLDLVASVLEADPDVVDLVTEIHEITAHGVVVSRAQTRSRPVARLGTEVALLGVRDGQIAVVEFYEERDRDVALARLEELTAS